MSTDSPVSPRVSPGFSRRATTLASLTASEDMIQRALPVFAAAIQRSGGALPQH